MELGDFARLRRLQATGMSLPRGSGLPTACVRNDSVDRIACAGGPAHYGESDSVDRYTRTASALRRSPASRAKRDRFQNVIYNGV